MLENGLIIIVDDDADDRLLIEEALKDLDERLEVKTFAYSSDALNYLVETTDRPVLIICDINMPMVNGIEFRIQMLGMKELHKRTIPFVFLTTTASPETINKAHELQVQGFFVKQLDYKSTFRQLQAIIQYWLHSEPFFLH
ncbi:response regulator [Chitinophaga rhizophila]|uniref:Response regulator n=1 Tax=Chitinophaga rhizophila TaxID=2866212 RepID=A0ABS7GHQ8_9BACT|nr:response regulator [Chitinophaga rhizophila]MBW8687233.1 response regulator [Chitinophaga rhizophila]